MPRSTATRSLTKRPELIRGFMQRAEITDSAIMSGSARPSKIVTGVPP